MNRKKEENNETQIKEQVRASLDRYFGFMHSRINAIAHLDINEMDTMQRAGWDMNITKEDLPSLIDDFINVYGFIYKEGKTSDPGTLVRGTTVDEMEKLREGENIERVLSTTKDEEIAKRFCQYGNAALARIRTTNNLPYVYVEEFKDENAQDQDEGEVLILPFAKVKGVDFVSNWGDTNIIHLPWKKQNFLK